MIENSINFINKLKSVLRNHKGSKALAPSLDAPAQKFFILMIAPTPFYSNRGTHIRILNEAEALALKGHKINIVTYHIGDTPTDLHPNITIKRINRLFWWYTKRESGPSWQKLCLDLLLCIKVLRICIREKPSILHGHLHEGVLIGWIVQKLLLNHQPVLIGDFHGTLVEEMRAHGYLQFQFVQTLFTSIEKLIYRIPCVSFVSSPSLKSAVESDCNGSEVFVLSDAPTLAKQSANGITTTNLVLKKDLPSVVYTGGFTPDKGIDVLFQIIAYSLQKGLACQWILAGSPFKKLFIPPDIKSAITVISPLDQNKLTLILENADVACDPKKERVRQGSGKILNYMYAGAPPVCFDGLAQRYYLGDELASRLIAQDIPHFYNILKQILGLPAEEKDQLKKMILQRIKLFSWSKSADTLEYYYVEQWKKNQK